MKNRNLKHAFEFMSIAVVYFACGSLAFMACSDDKSVSTEVNVVDEKSHSHPYGHTHGDDGYHDHFDDHPYYGAETLLVVDTIFLNEQSEIIIYDTIVQYLACEHENCHRRHCDQGDCDD